MIYTEQQLQQAREYAALINWDLAAYAFDIEESGFASHVTIADRREYADKQGQYAREIEQGLHDNNFTIWQRMQYYFTGETIPLLPK